MASNPVPVASADANGNEFAGRQLFGGAAVIELPMRFVDVSLFRQVPDTQEVFADANTDQSLMVDMLEMIDCPPQEAAANHFSIIAQSNEAVKAEIVNTVPPVVNADGSVLTIVQGTQEVAKFNERATNIINVQVACVRIPRFTADIVISFNSPQWIAAASSSAKAMDHRMSAIHDTQAVTALFQHAISSFRLHDTSLFC
jgi:peroxiredoxin